MAKATPAVRERAGVLDTLVIAAPEAYYTLACTLRATDQRTAERDWFNSWRGVIQHMQGSLLAP